MATNQATATQQVAKKASSFEQELRSYEPQIAAALPSHIPMARFKRTFITAINSNPGLAKLERRSLFTALVKCAQDGLLPDGREAALIAFKDRAQYLPMVAGVIKRMRNSGDLVSVSAHVVYANDKFTLAYGDHERIEHEPALGERGKPIGAYAIAKLNSGEVQREFMSLAEIEKVRNVSRAKADGPWVTWWDEMARKSVVKRLAKYLPMSADVQDMIRRDDEISGVVADPAPSKLAALLAAPDEQPMPDGTEPLAASPADRAEASEAEVSRASPDAGASAEADAS